MLDSRNAVLSESPLTVPTSRLKRRIPGPSERGLSTPGLAHDAPLFVNDRAAADRRDRPTLDGPTFERRVVRAGRVVRGTCDALEVRVEDRDIGERAFAQHASLGVETEGSRGRRRRDFYEAFLGKTPLADTSEKRTGSMKRRSLTPGRRRPISSSGSIFCVRVHGA